jgi:tRNA C32,U32 (ribose-2'-O)-methylase TrmJ
MGNEKMGLSETAISGADSTVYVPMKGMVESLNLSVSTALCLAEITRHRQIAVDNQEGNWEKYQLDTGEQEQLVEQLEARQYRWHKTKRLKRAKPRKEKRAKNGMLHTHE